MYILISLFICSVAVTSTFGFHDEFDKSDNLTEVQEAFIKYELNTRLHYLPENKLIVHFDTDYKVNLGEELVQTNVSVTPNVYYDADPEAHYTLIMFDVDSPSRKKPFFGDLLLWMVVNIPGSKVHKGETIVSYGGHTPARNSGLHRIVLLAFKQREKHVFEEDYIPRSWSFFRRVGFCTAKFVAKYHLGKPVAGNFFEIQHDISIANDVHSNENHYIRH